jgi:hypothetical protein
VNLWILRVGNWEAEMRNGQSSNGAKSSDGSKLPPTGDDDSLLTLEMELDDLIRELLTAQKANGELVMSFDQRSLPSDGLQAGAEATSDHDARTKQVEAILARLYPIEQAIMATPAHTIVGLGVKARHAAYVMSQYWEAPIDQIDWDARAVRLLIEAVCDAARAPLGLSST